MPDPSACRWCGIPKRNHLQRWRPLPVGWHVWTEPTKEQRYAAIRANAAERKSAPDTAMDEFEAADDLSRRWE